MTNIQWLGISQIIIEAHGTSYTYKLYYVYYKHYYHTANEIGTSVILIKIHQLLQQYYIIFILTLVIVIIINRYLILLVLSSDAVQKPICAMIKAININDQTILAITINGNKLTKNAIFASIIYQ